MDNAISLSGLQGYFLSVSAEGISYRVIHASDMRLLLSVTKEAASSQPCHECHYSQRIRD